MISHRRKFVFVHVSKTGGQSVRKALRPFALTTAQRLVQYVDTRTLRYDPFGINQAGSHPNVAKLKSALGDEVFDSYYSFSFVRNLWSRLLSYYYFMKIRPRSEKHEAAMTLDFNDFINTTIQDAPLRDQSSILLDADGKSLVNFIGRFETLATDFGHVCETLGCGCTLPHKNKTKHGDFRTAYNQSSVDIVSRLYANDIKFFNYNFE